MPEALNGEAVFAPGAPRAVGAYAHARKAGGFVFVCGVGPRQVGTDEIPGGPIRGPDGAPRDYDATAQTRAVIANVKAILEAAGSSLEKVVDVTVYLVDMQRDFAAMNAVWREAFGAILPARTTLEVGALPTPIAVEMKVVALA